MTIIRYDRDGRPLDPLERPEPDWDDVEEAIRRMDNFCYPIVQLHLTEYEDGEDTFNIIGGDGQWALFQSMGEWQYEDPNGGPQEVRLWESDQGYFCQEKHVITDVDKVLRLTRKFYNSGSYDRLDDVV